MSAMVEALLNEIRGDPQAISELRQILGLDDTLTEPAQPDLTLLTCSQAAQRAGCHVQTIRTAIRNRRLHARYVGRSPRIAIADLDAWMSPALTRDRPRRRTIGRPNRHLMFDAITALNAQNTIVPRHARGRAPR